MPTPFYHISVADKLRRHPTLEVEARVLLDQQCSAFLLGSTAPDVHILSGQSRQATHFFDLPLRRNGPPAWDQIIAHNPSFLSNRNLPPAKAAFIAGFLCHLQADWLWVREIFLPAFGPQHNWSTFKNRLYLHDALRAYMDKKALSELPADVSQILRQVRPQQWLPFILDLHLIEWRDFLSDQLAPGAVDLTVEIFAARQGIPPDEFHHLLGSEARMDKEIFAHLPQARLQEYHERLVGMNLCLLNDYLVKNKRPLNRVPDSIIEGG